MKIVVGRGLLVEEENTRHLATADAMDHQHDGVITDGSHATVGIVANRDTTLVQDP